MDRVTESIVTIALAIVGLATIAVLVSRNAKTTEVIGAGSQGFVNSLLAAVSPVSGGGNGLGSNFQSRVFG